jgi:putative ABC transport system substrate-binding protein
MYAISSYADAGGLMVYAASVPGNFHRAAVYVDKIFKGSSPADLPVEKPTAFDFVVNLRTAQTLGLTVPPSILQQATGIIE